MKRIQRKRTRGWKMPENCKYIGRPTKWGNPFRDVGDMVYIYDKWRAKAGLDPWIYLCMQHEFGGAVKMYRECVENPIRAYVFYSMDLVAHFRAIEESLHELYGYDLCCWCGIDKECHGDVLIELVNQRN